MRKFLIIILSVSLLTILGSLAYYFVIELPKQDQEEIQRYATVESQLKKLQKEIINTDSDVSSADDDIQALQSDVSDIHDAMNL